MRDGAPAVDGGTVDAHGGSERVPDGHDPYRRDTSEALTAVAVVPLTLAVSPGVSGTAAGDDGTDRTTVLRVPDGRTFEVQLRPAVLAVTYRRHVPTRTFTGLVRTFRREGFPVVVEALERAGWRRAWIVVGDGHDPTRMDETRALFRALLEDDDAVTVECAPPLTRPVKGWAGLVSPSTVPDALETLAGDPPGSEALTRAVGRIVPERTLAWLRTPTGAGGAGPLWSAVASLVNLGWTDGAIVRVVLDMPAGDYTFERWRQDGPSPSGYLERTVVPRCRDRVEANPSSYDPTSALEAIERHRAAAGTVWAAWPTYRRSVLAALWRLAHEQGGGRFGASERDVAGIVGCDRRTVREHRAALLEDGWLRQVEEGTGRLRSRWELTVPRGGNIPPQAVEQSPDGGWKNPPTTSHLSREDQPSNEPAGTTTGLRRSAPEGGRRSSPSGYDGPHDAYRPGALGVAGDTLALIDVHQPRTDRELWELTPGDVNLDAVRKRRQTLHRYGLIERRHGGWIKVDGWEDRLDTIAVEAGTAGTADTVRRRHEAEREANLERLAWETLLRDGPSTVGRLAERLDLTHPETAHLLARLHEAHEAVQPRPDGAWSAVERPTTTARFTDEHGQVLEEVTLDSTPGRSWVPSDLEAASDELAAAVLADLEGGETAS